MVTLDKVLRERGFTQGEFVNVTPVLVTAERKKVVVWSVADLWDAAHTVIALAWPRRTSTPESPTLLAYDAKQGVWKFRQKDLGWVYAWIKTHGNALSFGETLAHRSFGSQVDQPD
jgi:hypothetical protein